MSWLTPERAAAQKVELPVKWRAITYIVPWPASGGADLSVRLLAGGLEKELGVPILVVNKAGATT